MELLSGQSWCIFGIPLHYDYVTTIETQTQVDARISAATISTKDRRDVQNSVCLRQRQASIYIESGTEGIFSKCLLIVTVSFSLIFHCFRSEHFQEIYSMLEAEFS